MGGQEAAAWASLSAKLAVGNASATNGLLHGAKSLVVVNTPHARVDGAGLRTTAERQLDIGDRHLREVAQS